MILSRNRTFKREPPTESSKLFIIVCEGKRREGDYFNYFSELDSRVAVEVIKPVDGDDNSPTGLFDKAMVLLDGTEEMEPKYELKAEDEVWFVIDTDDWGEKIAQLRESAGDHDYMSVAQSNPCFEVWLYYHLSAERPEFIGYQVAENWKSFLDGFVPGGFNSRKHPIMVASAIHNAREHFSPDGELPEAGTTEVFLLAERIYDIIGPKIDSARIGMDV